MLTDIQLVIVKLELNENQSIKLREWYNKTKPKNINQVEDLSNVIKNYDIKGIKNYKIICNY